MHERYRDNPSTSSPLVSVIIPTYNCSKHLAEAIGSALRQTYKKLELLVIDDASSDDTQTMLEQLNDPRIRRLCHAHNQGGANARNTGIDAATGDYVAFLDADDLWLPQKLETQLQSLEGYEESELLSYSQFYYDDGHERVISPMRGKRQDEAVGDYIFISGGHMLTSTLLMPRALAKRIRFRDGLRRHQDNDLCLRLEAAGVPFFFLEEPLSVYNANDRSNRMSNSIDIEVSQGWLELNRPLLSPEAAFAFQARIIAPRLVKQKKRLEAGRLVLEAKRQGAVSNRLFMGIMSGVLLPGGLHKKLRSLYRRTRGRIFNED